MPDTFGECPSGGPHHWTTMEGKDSNGTPIRWNACSKCGARG